MKKAKDDIQKTKNEYKYPEHAKRLTSILNNSPYTRAEIEDILHMCRNGLQRYLNGKSKLDYDTAVLLAKTLELRVEYILNPDDNNPTEELYNLSQQTKNSLENMMNTIDRLRKFKTFAECYQIPDGEYPFLFWQNFIEYIDKTITDSINIYFDIFTHNLYSMGKERLSFDDFMSMEASSINDLGFDSADEMYKFFEEAIHKEN